MAVTLRKSHRFRRSFRFKFWVKETSRCALLWLMLLLLLVSFAISSWNDDGGSRVARDTLSEQSLRVRRNVTANDDSNIMEELNCTMPSIFNFPEGLFTTEERRRGAIIIDVAIMIYMFASIAIICDDYFMPALHHLSDDLKMKKDVAGATFMAIGGSAPEVFAAVIGVFIAKGDVGLGTIVGSAVYNLLFVIGLCGILAHKEMLLTCWPLVRDSICYRISITGLIFAVSDLEIRWYDAVVLLLLYVGYLTLMYHNEKLENAASEWMQEYFKLGYKRAYDLERSKENDEMEMLVSEHSRGDDEESPILEDEDNAPNGNLSNHDNKSENDDEAGNGICSVPNTIIKFIPWLMSLPILLTFFITIPDCKKRGLRCLYPITFVMSLCWIGVLTFILVWMVTIIGYDLGIHDTITSLTLLAAGASTPDTILSVIAAREGYGDMAVSHSIGSNQFDILVGLGVPWLIQTVFIKFNSTIPVFSGAMLYICLLLLVNVVALFACIVAFKFKLNAKLGVFLLLLFCAFIALSLLLEMNMIIPNLTLPICDV